MRTEPVFEIKENKDVLLVGTNFLAESKAEADLLSAMFGIELPKPLSGELTGLRPISKLWSKTLDNKVTVFVRNPHDAHKTYGFHVKT